MPKKASGHPRQIIVEGDIARIELTQGYWATIDAEDVPRVSQYHWYYNCINKNGYGIAVCKMPGKRNIPLHRFVLGLTNRSQVCDHISGNPLDCRKGNLRVTTHAGNCRNMIKRKSNCYRGVYHKPKKTSPWRLRLKIGGDVSLGYYKNEAIPALLADCVQIKVAHAMGHPVSLRVLNFPNIVHQTLANYDTWLREILNHEQIARLESAIADHIDRVACDRTYLYLAIRADNAVKIGVSRNPKTRVAKIRYGVVKGSCPQTKLLDFFPFPTADMAYKIESELHSLFASKRCEGEFFKLDESDLEFIKQKISHLMSLP